MTIAYLNGEYLPLEKAYVPVMDRGYLFGDGVYEVIPVYQGKAFRSKEHFDRLVDSLKGIRLDAAIDVSLWENICRELIERNGGGNLTVYFQITRGAAPKRDHTFPLELQPTIFAYAQAFTPHTVEELRAGGSVVTLPDIRWTQCHIKSINLLGNALQRQIAKDKGADEAILILDGFAIEGTASNLFIVSNGVISTPPLDPHMLGGITRDFILEIVDCQERKISEAELHTADEIWMTGSVREIHPMVKLNDRPVGNGKAGPVWESIIQKYRQAISKNPS